jgi:multiple sugar transport system substrate-binding protein
MKLRLALVGGPMYDPVYRLLDERRADVEIAVHADHPTLNRRVAEILGGGGRLDLISTHAKYAPSQAAWLRPLDGLVDTELLAALEPRALELCRFRGELLSVPRNVDVRVLWARRDLVARLPDTWAELESTAAAGAAFGFPGRESGLFGTFFEIVTAHGGRLFDDAGAPAIDSPQAEAAIDLLVRLAAHAPADLPDWHYDQVDRALFAGQVAMAAAWPGGYGPLRGSPHYANLVPHPYPAGPAGRFSYAGAHSWAIPRSCADLDGALALLHLLAGEEGARIEAAGGGATAHRAVAMSIRPIDATDRDRLELTQRAIAEQMITYPPNPSFPAVEDAGWQAIQAALRGQLTARAAAKQIQETALRVLAAAR